MDSCGRLNIYGMIFEFFNLFSKKFIFSTFFVMIEGKRKILKKLDQCKLYYDEYPNQNLVKFSEALIR